MTTTTSATSAPAAATATTDTTGGSTLGKDDFLKLMITQLQNQDPLNPMDNQAFVAQLAQFSNLEQLQGVNTRLDSLTLGQANANQQSATNLVGRDVRYSSNQVAWTAGSPSTPIGARLSANVASVTAVISDINGQPVRTINFGPQVAGSFSATWDGLDAQGNAQPTGTYSVTFTATDPQNNVVDAPAQGIGRVTGVTFDANGAVSLVIGNGLQVQLGSVTEVDQPKP